MAKEEWDYFKLHKKRDLWPPIRTNCSSRSHHVHSFSPNPLSEKQPSSPLQFG